MKEKMAEDEAKDKASRSQQAFSDVNHFMLLQKCKKRHRGTIRTAYSLCLLNHRTVAKSFPVGSALSQIYNQ